MDVREYPADNGDLISIDLHEVAAFRGKPGGNSVLVTLRCGSNLVVACPYAEFRDDMAQAEASLGFATYAPTDEDFDDEEDFDEDEDEDDFDDDDEPPPDRGPPLLPNVIGEAHYRSTN